MGFSHTSSPRSGASRDSFHECLAAFVAYLKQEGLTLFIPHFTIK